MADNEQNETRPISPIRSEELNAIWLQLDNWASSPNQIAGENRKLAAEREWQLWNEVYEARQQGKDISDLHLDWSHLNLTGLSPTCCLLPITTFSLQKNKLRTLPEEFGQLLELRTIDISGNGLIALPLNINLLTKIENANLSNNALSTLPPGIGSWSRAEVIDLSDNHLYFLPHAMGNMTELRKLLVSNNRLTGLGAMVGNMGKLEILDVSRNEIPTLPDEIDRLTRLVELLINNNEITELPDLRNMQSLELLNANDNNITRLASSLRFLSKLKDAWFEGNTIVEFPSSLAQWPTNLDIRIDANLIPPHIKALTDSLNWQGPTFVDVHSETPVEPVLDNFALELDEPHYLQANEPLSYQAIEYKLIQWRDHDPEIKSGENREEAVERELALWRIVFEAKEQGYEVPNLHLKLENLGLTKLSPTCCDLPLVTFKLKNNRLETLPDEIGKLERLQILDVGENRLTALNNQIGRLRQLEELDVSKNKLPSLPLEIGDLSSLTSLKASRNRISRIPAEIAKLHNLDKLILNKNELTYFPPDIHKLLKLETLELDQNRIKEIPENIVALRENLQKLSVRSNEITGVPSTIGDLFNLTILDISKNKIAELPSTLEGLSALETLHADENELTKVNFRISECESLMQLTLSRNRIATIPDEDWSIFEDLYHVDFGYNLLTAPPQGIEKSPALDSLILEGNNIQSFP
ncbi:MAG: hypothetical protein V4568_13305 [Pseudomonadota bacterium]